MGRKRIPIKERIMKHVVVTPEGCWEWQASGAFIYKGGAHTPRKAAYLIWNELEELPEYKKVVPTQCHNRKCVNPEHLSLVSPKTPIWQLKQEAAARKNPSWRLRYP